MQVALLFALGSSLGSFCNLCIYRLPRRLNVITGRSFCPHCKATLRWFELIPLLSFLISRGRCLRCASKISLQYPVVEAISGVIVVLVCLGNGFTAASVKITLFLLAMLVVAFTDFQKFMIPNIVLLISFIAGVILEIAACTNCPSGCGIRPLYSAFLSSAFSFALMYFILLGGNFLFKKETMGPGDVKLAGVVGFYIGWKMFLAVLWTAAVAGGLYGSFMILVLKRSREMRLPFGAFLAAAAGIAAVIRAGVY